MDFYHRHLVECALAEQPLCGNVHKINFELTIFMTKTSDNNCYE